MSCGGPTKKMRDGGPSNLPKPRVVTASPYPTKTPKTGPIKAIKKVLKKLTPRKTTPGCFGAGCGKMQEGGTLPKAQNGRNVINYPKPAPRPEPAKIVGGRGPIKTIKKVINKLKPRKTNTGCFGANCGKMQLGGSLETFRDGGERRARQQGSLPSRSSCGEKIKRRKASWARQDKAGKILKGVGTAAGVIGGIGLAGAAAYKKSTPFKNAVDELKGKLGFNKTGGAVKKYRDGGPTDSLKVIKTQGKLAVKTEKQKQAAAKKAAANAKKIAKAKENARLNLEWQKMTKDQKDSLFISERQKNW